MTVVLPRAMTEVLMKTFAPTTTLPENDPPMDATTDELTTVLTVELPT